MTKLEKKLLKLMLEAPNLEYKIMIAQKLLKLKRVIPNYENNN